MTAGVPTRPPDRAGRYGDMTDLFLVPDRAPVTAAVPTPPPDRAGRYRDMTDLFLVPDRAPVTAGVRTARAGRCRDRVTCAG